MRIPVIFSTVTGNAYKLAAAAAEVTPERIGPYNIRYITGKDGLRAVNYVTDEIVVKYDVFILTYWCDLGSADEDTLALLSRLNGKKLILLGTLGAPADGAHAVKVRENVEAAASRNNTVLAHYLCRGSVDLYRSDNKRLVPAGQKGSLDEKGYARHLESQGHPDAADLAEAKRVVTEALARLRL
ncbi:MAG: flavodoxin family protein [Clostridiales bacterium]|jgi:hypothetical protein|nr:flavodoxin family protein [Clostridiales bacterium]